MKNNWQYATLTQAEKLKRIASGDVDLYNTEIANVKNFGNLLKGAGVDTSNAV